MFSLVLITLLDLLSQEQPTKAMHFWVIKDHSSDEVVGFIGLKIRFEVFARSMIF